jgi:hypothetical protein
VQVLADQAGAVCREQAWRDPEKPLRHRPIFEAFAVVDVGEVLQAAINALRKAVAEVDVKAILADTTGALAIVFKAAGEEG